MKDLQNCAIARGYVTQETKSSKLKRYLTKLLTSFKICNAEELSKKK